MQETTRALPEHDLRMVEVIRGEHALVARETTYGESTRTVFDHPRHTHCLELPLAGQYALARLMGVSPKELPRAIEDYLYRDGSYLTDVMDLLDMQDIPYRHSIEGRKDDA